MTEISDSYSGEPSGPNTARTIHNDDFTLKVSEQKSMPKPTFKNDVIKNYFGSKTSKKILNKFNNFEKNLTIKTNLHYESFEVLSNSDDSVKIADILEDVANKTDNQDQINHSNE